MAALVPDAASAYSSPLLPPAVWQQAAPQLAPAGLFVPDAHLAHSLAAAPLSVPTAGLSSQFSLDLNAGLGLSWLPVLQEAAPAAPPAGQHLPAAGSGKAPRLRWTASLHASFVSAVKELGGAQQATPKRILDLMAVPGITLFHVKSHLQKFRTMVGEEQPGARRRAAAKRRAAAMRATDSSSSDSEDEEEPAGGCEAPPPPARHIDKQARTQDDAAEAAAAQAQASSGDVDTGSGACKDDLLVGALAKQVEMQSQLQRQLEAQRALQEQLEEHSRFIEQLLRSEGPVPTKQPVRPAGSAAAGAPANGRAASRAHKQSASSRTRTTVPLVLPVVAAAAPGMPRTGSTPELAAAVPCFQLPPLQLHVPPVPAAVDLRRWQALLPAQPTDGLSSTLQGCVPQLPAASGTSGISAASAFAACGVSALPAHKAPAHQQAGPEYADPDPRLDSGTLSAEAWDWLVDDCDFEELF